MFSKRLIGTLLGLTALTCLNVGYRLYRDRTPTALPNWEFPLNTGFPKATFRPLAAASAGERAKPSPTGCRVVVFFDVKCPHCHTAKLIEASVPDSVRLPVVWLTMTDDEPSAAFEKGLSPTSVLRTANRAELAPIVVRATPIAFLVSSDDVVRNIFPYDGSATQHTVERRFCTATQPSKGA